jgi:hypothetical protein
MDDREGKPMGNVIHIDEARIRHQLGEMVRGTVEEALNAMLDAEADRLCGADRCQGSEARKDTRAGHDEGAHAWACIASLIETCKLNDVEPLSYLTATLEAIANGHPISRLDELLPGPFAKTSTH